MKIIILGGGQVGLNIANSLIKAGHDHDIAIIDSDASKLRELQLRLDIKTICYWASHPWALVAAEADNADLLIAVTSSDEVNFVACQVAYSLFDIPVKIARIRNREYFTYPELFSSDNLPVDIFISPEELITQQIQELIMYSGADQVCSFAKNLIKVLVIKVNIKCPLLNINIEQLQLKLKIAKIMAIYRTNKLLSNNEYEITLQNNDEIVLAVGTQNIEDIFEILNIKNRFIRNVIISGGSNIGVYLAKILEKKYHIKLIESDQKLATDIADNLSNTTILQGEITDKELLINENIDNTDIFCAVSSNDANNIMSSLLAKKLGAKKTITLVKDKIYLELITDNEIDIMLSPHQLTSNDILRYVREADIAKIYSLNKSEAIIIEFIIDKDIKNNHIINQKLSKIKFSKGIVFGAILRNNKVLIIDSDTIIMINDHLIVFASDNKKVIQLEKIFQTKKNILEKHSIVNV